MIDDKVLKEYLNKYTIGQISTSELYERLSESDLNYSTKSLLSEGQKGIWAIQKLNQESTAYNIPICFEFQKKVNLDIFRKVVEYVMEKYPILKSTIIQDNDKLYQVIDAAMPISYDIVNIPDMNEEELLNYVKKLANTPFSLDKGPLFRVHVLVGKNKHVVLINIHHIICDGTSSVILTKELLNAYHHLIEDKELNFIEVKTSYSDFVDWEKDMLSGKIGENHRNFWKEQLKGDLPVTKITSDVAVNEQNEIKANMFQVSILKEIKEKIEEFSKKQRIGLPSFFLAVLNIFLYQCTNQNESIVGTACMGRTEERFESLVGYFINMIPIRSKINITDSFSSYVNNLQLTMLECLEHADYPYTSIAKDRSKEHNNTQIFEVAYYYQNFLQSEFISSLKKYEDMFGIKFLSSIHQAGEYDFVLEVLEQEDEILLSIKYNEAIYPKELIEHYANNMCSLSENIAKNPSLEIQKYPLISKEEERKILFDWNDTDINYSNNKMVHELFEEQANENPHKVAVVYENESLTYEQLNEKSEKLAVYLQSIGVEPDTLVGICVERSLDMIVGLLAILKAGGAYVPLDPEYPNERVQYMIENSNINIILTQSDIQQKKDYLRTDGLRAILLDRNVENLYVSKKLERKAELKNLAYVLYTSGSTGKPKGVMIPHDALTNFLLQMADKPGLGSNDVLLAVTTFCFDIAGLELFLPLIKGAKYYICSSENKRDIQKLKKEIQQIKPTIMQATPATWMALYLVGWRNEERVKILCGGEALPEKLKKYFMDSKSEAWNMFGPTETTIWSTMKKVEEDEITIGKPMANTQVYILNKNDMPVPIGVPGELYIGGTGLARGYYNREDLTKERFVDNPFVPGTKMYKTGDVAKWTLSGEIDFIGRADNQVKIHGFRIELAEIETKMDEYDEIEQSAVIVSEQDGNKRLKAFFVGKNKESGRKIDLKQLRSYLKSCLPIYMVPSVFVQIDKLPLTPNGKINRLELGNYKETDKVSVNEEVKEDMLDKKIDLNQIRTTLLEIWKEIIGNDEIEISDGFFEAGGDSILAVLIIERINKQYLVNIKVTHLFEYSNIANLSEYIAEEMSKVKIAGSMTNNTDARIEIEREKSDLDEYKNCVAIIGISCQLPGAKNADEFWNNLINKRECTERLTREEMLKMNVPIELIDNPKYVPIRLCIEGKEFFDNEFFNISPRDAENMNPQMRLLLQNAWRAVEDAGYTSKNIAHTGVYMSSSNNSYLSSKGMIDSSDSYVKWLMNQEGTIPTMISYKLGLIGPSLAVHSNCSSGLVGLSMAYQSIQLGDIDYALVGASTIHGKDNAGYLYVPGMNFSKDGHICAFDAKADGMLGGEGVAVIMIKNAKKAIQDNDHIYAMLRGISVSNDGTEKVGFYAPSIKGQAYTIEKTIEKTGINPETIRYIEAHGTGTKLGDPIEFKALKKVYEKYTNEKQFCGIGSVKTNIGHLDTVAGLAGCIKLALGLKNKKIPATINYDQANPEIDFTDSPFFMAQEAVELGEYKTPSRVSLSSFGIGGTNVHAILEEYIKGEGKDVYAFNECIVPVSAKDEERLKEYIQTILDYLEIEKNMKLELYDIAYTMQTGREAMLSRVIFCAKSVAELKEKMNLYIKHGKQTDEYATDEAIRKMQELWIAGGMVNWEELYRERTKPKKVSLPAYPFAKRGFWHKEKDGEKLFINKNANAINKVHYLIDSNTSTFMKQKYTTKLTGDEFYLEDHIINGKEVLPGVIYIEMARAAGQDAVKRRISKIKNVVWPRSITVEQPCNVHVILDNTGENQINFNVVTIENNYEVVHSQGKLFYHNLTETKLDEEAQNQYFDVESYRRKCDGHVTRDEFYNSSLSAVYQYGVTFQPIRDMYFNDEQSLCYLEVPKERYSDFDEFEIHPSILEGCLQSITGLLYRGDRSPFMPYAIEEINIYKRFTKKCIAYATYSDNQTSDQHLKKYNIRLFDMDGRILAFIRNYTIRKIPSGSQSTVETENGLAMQMYHYEWKKKDKQEQHNYLTKVEPMLIFDLDEKLKNEYGDTNHIMLVTPGKTFREYGEGKYEIIPDKEECYQKLFEQLMESKQLPNQIVYRWTNTISDEVNMRTGFYAILYISRTLIKLNIKEKVKLLYLYQDENNYETVINDSISGFTRTLRIERPNLVFKTIKIKGYQNSIKDLIANELLENDFNEVYFQNGEKYVKKLVKNDTKYNDQKVPFKESGTYLITGGAGKLGLLTAKFLASRFRANIILAGRSPLDDKKKQNMEELKALGASAAVYICADLSKRSDVVRMREEIESKFISVQGIICCQGVIQDSLITNKTTNHIEEVLRAKIDATILLDEVMKDEQLDFLLLFSSVSHFGNVGQADYAVANSFLNNFSGYRQKMCEEYKRYGKTVSISWPIWEHGGMHIENSVLEKQKEKTGVYALPDQIGLEAIQASLMQAHDNIIVLYGENSRIGDFVSSLNNRDNNLIELNVKRDHMNEKLTELNVKRGHMDQIDLSENVLTFLKDTAGELIKVTNFDADKELDSYGFDSISNTEFANKINEYYGIDIMPTVFFELEQPTVRSLRDYLLKNFYNRLSLFYGEIAKVPNGLENRIKDIEKHTSQTQKPNESILNEVTEYLARAIEDLQKIENVDIDKDMNSYGFDSISNTELCNLINEHYHIELMPTIFFELDEFTVRGTAKYICENYGKELSGFYGNLDETVSSQNEKRMIQSSKETHSSPEYEEKVTVQTPTYHTVENSVEDAVAIIGMDGVFPQSESLNEFWNKLEQGDSLITEIPTDRFNWQEFEDPCMKWGAFMKNVNLFDADFFGMSKQEAEVLDPQHRLFMQVTWNTIGNAGYRPSSLSGTDTGIFVGIGTQDYTQIVEENLTEFNPYALTGRSPFMMPNRISSLLNINGPSEAIDTACSSSLVAIHKAAEAVKMGTCKMAIAGGVNLILSPLVHQAFSSANMLSKDGRCKVFDKDADGTVRGEGVGAILLKRLSDAKKDGDHIYAVIRSSGENHKGKSASLTAPNAIAEKELIKSVYEKENIDPSTVTYMEVHSTGTKLGDPVEIAGLKNAFAELSQKYGVDLESHSCAISSVKPIIGHLEAAAGIASVIKVLLSLKYKKILKVLNFKELNPYISIENSPFYINQTNRTWESGPNGIPRRAGVSAFGFGGVNAHLLIEEYIEDTKEESPYLIEEKSIVLSGKNKAVIDKQAKQLLEAIELNNFTNNDLSNIAYTLQTGREEYEERIGFSVRTIDELKKKLQIVISQEKSHNSKIFHGKVSDNSNLISVLDKNDMINAIINSLILSGQSEKLLELWVNGVSIDWKRVYGNTNVKKVPLPAYPFMGKPYWVELKKEKKQLTTTKIQNEDTVRIESDTEGLASSAVMSVLTQMLGIEAGKIDMNSTASELGVDSIVLMQILRKVQTINPDVDFEVLYQCETILDIINTVSLNKDGKTGYKGEIKKQKTGASKKEDGDISKTLAMIYGTAAKGDEKSILEKYPELVKMNHCSEGRPVFWLHGGFGGVEIYRLITSEFKRPFYGIQARGYMTNEETIEGIEEMAAYYVEIIESIQPSGPYDLGGLSMGGILAYEVCRQLQLKNQKVNSIVMLESIYVDEIMRTEWCNISTVDLTKDQMFRAGNLLLSFSSDTELKLITENELTQKNASDEEFLEHLISILKEHGMKKSSKQLKQLIISFQKMMNTLDLSTTFYEAEKLTSPQDTQCYYFCNPQGSLFGEDEEHFRLVDKGRSYDFNYFAQMWKERMPKLEMITINSSNHMTILTESDSRDKILEVCTNLYAN